MGTLYMMKDTVIPGVVELDPLETVYFSKEITASSIRDVLPCS